MKQTFFQYCGMLLALLLASASQCFGQLPLNQFKSLSDSAYQAVPEYLSGNKYQKDAILFMGMVADTHPYYIKEERRAEWFAKKQTLIEQCKSIETDEAFADALIEAVGAATRQAYGPHDDKAHSGE